MSPVPALSVSSLEKMDFGCYRFSFYYKQILDNESVVASAEGKGHVVLPAFTFLRDRTEDDEKYSHRSK